MALQIGELFWIYDCVGNHYYVRMIKFVPNVSLSAEANISKELTVFKNPHILIVIAIIVFGYSGVFTTYTFMEPMIRDFSPFKSQVQTPV